MKLDGIHHVGLNVLDIDRAEKFYTDVLGFRMEKRYKEEIRHLMLEPQPPGNPVVGPMLVMIAQSGSMEMLQVSTTARLQY